MTLRHTATWSARCSASQGPQLIGGKLHPHRWAARSAACCVHVFSSCAGIAFNNTAADGQQWWNMTSAERSTAMARAAAVNLRNSPPANRPNAAAAAAITQLWEYYNHPHLLNRHCNQAHGTAVAVLVALGLACRLSVWVLVRIKVARKAQQ